LKLFYSIPEQVYKICGFLFFIGATCHKVYLYPIYSNKVLWGIETSIFLLIALFIVTRKPLKKKAEGFNETIIPLLGGIWPFFLLFTKRCQFGLTYQKEILLIMCVSTGFSLFSYLFLNTAFTIMVEARELKSSGPYKYILHPVYSGQIITAIAVLAWRFSLVNIFVCCTFIAIQNFRASLEEQKLASAFPEYKDYSEDKARFFPYIW